MLSFHNDAAIKQKYLDRVRHHREADNIIQGIGWEKGKGCAVGCTLEAYDHSRYPIELGIPEWMAYLEDSIFENLPNEESNLWPERFLSAVPVGVYLEPIKHKLAILRLNRLIKLQEDNLKNNPNLTFINDVINAIKMVINCHESVLNNLTCDWKEAWSASQSVGSAAWSAARSAWLSEPVGSAAWSAARSARSSVLSAALSSLSVAESVSDSVAWSVTWSAWAASGLIDWKQESEDLIYLLNNM